MSRKKRRLIRKILGWLVLFVLVLAVGSILFFSVRWVIHLVRSPSPLQEDETKYLSPPSNETILFRGTDNKIHLYHTGTKENLTVTEGPDYAPSWDTKGEGFYFLRKIDPDSYTVYYYSLSDQLERLLSTQEVYTAWDLPDPDNTWIRFSPDGKKIILSSMNLGIQMIDRENTDPQQFFKRKNIPLSAVWPDIRIVSRNNRYCLLTTHRNKNSNYISGFPNRIPLINQLFLFRTDLSESTLVDQSDTPFQGQSFSWNGYTFVYGKNNQIWYVDSLQSIHPRMIATGTFPSVKPNQKYTITVPRWTAFNLLNATVIHPLTAPFEGSLLLANHRSLAVFRIDTQQLKIFADKGKSRSALLGYQMIDLFLEDLNQDQIPEVLCSWQSYEKALGAERISQFSLTKQGSLREMFRSDHKLRNTWKWEDLNQDGTMEVLNAYADPEGEEVSMLENMTWTDVYQITPKRWILSNRLYPAFYKQMAETYRSFLTNAIKNPAFFGKSIETIEQWLKKSEEIVNQKR